MINSKIFPVDIVVLEVPYYSETLAISLVPRYLCMYAEFRAVFLKRFGLRTHLHS